MSLIEEAVREMLISASGCSTEEVLAPATMPSRYTPFTQEDLNEIFAISPKFPDRIISRENERREFKETFNFSGLAKYMRTAAGFANARGGYIVYGVCDSPHTLKGLSGPNDAFARLDPEKLTEFFNEHFDPEIQWDRQIYELGGKVFGLLYIHESTNKPVICRKSADDGKNLKEGEIYFRYRGRTQVIRYSELKELIDERRQREQLLWLRHLKEIARIGVRDVGLFDFKSGTVSGAGGSFLIDESIAARLAFIREGEFTEVKGKPALKLIGSLEPLAGGISAARSAKIIRQKGIRAEDIILAFLRSEKVDEPVSYFTQISFETSAYLPCYSLLKQAGLTIKQARELIAQNHSTSAAKQKLIERLDAEREGVSVAVVPQGAGEASIRKLTIRQQILAKSVPSELTSRQLRDTLEMIRTLKRGDMDESYLKKVLCEAFTKHYGRGDANLTTEIRRTICFVDMMLYGASVKSE